MRTTRGHVSAALTAIIASAGVALVATPSQAIPGFTCQGREATVVGNLGTEGDDVMVVLNQTGVAQALGGNDTICIAATPQPGIRSVVVDAGPGDDTVVNESTDTDDIWFTTILGSGADSYVGLDTAIPDNPKASPFHETVYAGERDLTSARLEWSLDTETDRIDTRGGDDVVYSGTTTLGAPNDDTVLLGTGNDELHWAGEQRAGTVDTGDGENALRVYPGWQGTSADVHARARAATVDGRTVLRWSGWVNSYHLTLGTSNQGFAGSDADETLILGPSDQPGPTAGRRTISMGRGDDVLALYSMGAGSVDGGPGRDSYTGTACSSASILIDRAYTCDSSGGTPTTFDFSRFEDLLVKGSDVTVVGTGRQEKIKVVASERIRVRGKGGDDVINANSSGRLRGDRPVVLSGGRGADRVVGSRARDRLLGGRGPDRLFGETRSDVLIGGPGRDKAFGQHGRDRCSAEVRRSCERG